MAYEVRGYITQEAFDQVRFSPVAQDIARKRDALAIGRGSLADYPIVKVQSDDREFIQILRRADGPTGEGLPCTLTG